MEFRWNLLIFLVIAIGMIITPVSADWMGGIGDVVYISDDNKNEYPIMIQMEYIKNTDHIPVDYTLKRINLFRGTNLDTDGSYIMIYRPDTSQFDWYTVKKDAFRRVPDQLFFTADTKCYTNVSYNTLNELYRGLLKEPRLHMHGHPMNMNYLESINLESFFKEHDCEKTYTVAGNTIFYYKVTKNESTGHWVMEKIKQGGLLQQIIVENIDLTNCQKMLRDNSKQHIQFAGCIDFITIVDDLGSKGNGDNARQILSAADMIRKNIPGIPGTLLREMHPLVTIGNSVYYYKVLMDVTIAMNAIEEINQA